MEDIKITEGTRKKLKVVWLCYFTNDNVQLFLKPYKKVNESSHWITGLIKLFENSNDIELHVISQHEWISGYKNFVLNSVHYHFFNKGIPLVGRHWPGFFQFDLWTGYFNLKRHISRIIKKVNPDIIHLHGAEHTYSFVTRKFLFKYPVFITIQGFVHKVARKTKIVNRRAEKEIELIKLFKHFGYRTEQMGVDIKSINPDAVLHWHSYAEISIIPRQVEKSFDLVFFARITQEKGIIDLLKALAIIKKEKPDIRLCIIGPGKTDGLKEMAHELNISDNIIWAGFLPTREDVHDMASMAKISVLPTFNDIVSGTIIESLFLKIPVVAYNTGSIHEVNKNNEIISLVDIGNISELAQVIKKLLDDENLLKKVAEKGYERAVEMFFISNNQTKQDLLNAYYQIINDYKK